MKQLQTDSYKNQGHEAFSSIIGCSVEIPLWLDHSAPSDRPSALLLVRTADEPKFMHPVVETS